MSRNIPPKKAPEKVLPKRKKNKSGGYNKLMCSLAEEIIRLEIENSDTIGSIKKRFYSIMRKYGIKEGTMAGKNVRLVANPDWVMAKQLFVSEIADHFRRIGIFESIPKDLEA